MSVQGKGSDRAAQKARIRTSLQKTNASFARPEHLELHKTPKVSQPAAIARPGGTTSTWERVRSTRVCRVPSALPTHKNVAG